MNPPSPARLSTDREQTAVVEPIRPTSATETRSLREHVALALGRYFDQLEGDKVTDVYDMVLKEIEPPLLQAVLRYTRNNQTQASSVLGMNRGTLRKKLKRYGLL